MHLDIAKIYKKAGEKQGSFPPPKPVMPYVKQHIIEYPVSPGEAPYSTTNTTTINPISGPVTPEGMPQINTDEEHDALEPGAPYMDSNGRIARKKRTSVKQ